MHKLCEKCEKSSWRKLGTYEFMNHILDSGCDGFNKKGKSKDKGKANPSAYHIGYAEGQRDAEQIKNAHLLQRAESAEAMLTATENKAAEYKSWAAKAVKEADELRARAAQIEEAIQKFCRECWAFRGLNVAQCRICAFNKYKGEMKS